MENRTKFNLTERLKIWKVELSHNSNMTRDNIDELESHLKDDMDELQKLGLSIEESMLIAQKRIGTTKELTTEFGKVNKAVFFRNKITPYLKGVLMYIAFITLTSLLTNFSIIVANKTGVNDDNLNYVSVGVLLFLTSILAVLSYKAYRSESLFLQKSTSIPILVGVILVSKLLTIFSFLFITRSIKISDFGILQMNLNTYKLIVGLVILITSCIVFYVSKRENKIKIAQ